MIIRTQRLTAKGPNGQTSTQIQTAESKKPGSTFKQKIVKSYETKIKPEIKSTAAKVKTKVKEAAVEASNDLKDMLKK